MSNSRKPKPAERQALLAELQAKQKRADRRRTAIIAVVVGALALGLIGGTAATIANKRSHDAKLEALASEPIAGVETFTDLSRNHVDGTVTYLQNPPVGGDHSAIDQNCGYYSQPIGDENAVHSLEHGAVWITHAPDLPADQLATLRTFAADSDYVLVSPRDGLPSPIVASAWGVQLKLDSADDARLLVFLAAYVNGPQTPEPGAACSGGIGNPE